MRIFGTFLIILFPIFLWAQKNSKFDKFIEKYDVIEYVNEIDNSKPELFWDAVWRNNKPLLKLYEACNEKKKTALDAQKTLGYAMLTSQSFYEDFYVLNAARELTDTLKKYLYNNESDLLVRRLDVIHDVEPNAFTTPDGQIFMTDSLVCLMKFSPRKLLGICAHEMTHFILQHSLSNAYATQKKLRKNEIIAGVAAGVSAASNTYAQANGAVGSDSWKDVETIVDNLFEAARDDAFNRYYYKYSRDQEVEADIVAYRFLEWMGIGGDCYIEALKLMGTEDDKYYSKQSEHPTMEMRIQLLEYLSNVN